MPPRTRPINILDQAEARDLRDSPTTRARKASSPERLAQGSLDTIEKLHPARADHGVPTGCHGPGTRLVGAAALDLVIIARARRWGRPAGVKSRRHFCHQDRHDGGVFQPRDVEGAVLFSRCSPEKKKRRIDAHRLARRGYLGERDWGRLRRRSAPLSESPDLIDDTPSIGRPRDAPRNAALALRARVHLVIIDTELIAGPRPLREPHAGARLDSRFASRGRAPRSGASTIVCLAAEPRPWNAHSDPVRVSGPTRVWRARAGRRRGRLHIPPGHVTRTRAAADPREGVGRADNREEAQRPRPGREARLHPRVHALRELSAGS